MALPDFQSIMLPLLKFVSDGKEHTNQEAHDHLAKELNDAGLDMKKTLKPEIDIPWNDKTVKEYMWKPIMKAHLGKESTTEMTTKDIDAVFAIINRHLGNRFGLEIEFPSIETLLLRELSNN